MSISVNGGNTAQKLLKNNGIQEQDNKHVKNEKSEKNKNEMVESDDSQNTKYEIDDSSVDFKDLDKAVSKGKEHITSLQNISNELKSIDNEINNQTKDLEKDIDSAKDTEKDAKALQEKFNKIEEELATITVKRQNLINKKEKGQVLSSSENSELKSLDDKGVALQGKIADYSLDGKNIESTAKNDLANIKDGKNLNSELIGKFNTFSKEIKSASDFGKNLFASVSKMGDVNSAKSDIGRAAYIGVATISQASSTGYDLQNTSKSANVDFDGALDIAEIAKSKAEEVEYKKKQNIDN